MYISHCADCFAWIISLTGHDTPLYETCNWAPFSHANLISAPRQKAEVNVELTFLLFPFSVCYKMLELSGFIIMGR